jgi:hypothetical protein
MELLHPKTFMGAGGALILIGISGILGFGSEISTVQAITVVGVLVGGISTCLNGLLWLISQKQVLQENERLKSENNKLKDTVNELENTSSPDFSPIRKPEDVMRLINKAHQSIWITGINAIVPLHSGRKKYIELLNSGGDVRILMLDRDSDAFKRREQKEENVEGRIAGRLRAEQDAALAIVSDITNHVRNDLRRNVQLRFHTHDPTYSLIVVDQEEMQISMYLTSTKGPGVHGPTFVLRKHQPKFMDYLKELNDLWLDAKPASLQDAT